MVSSNKNPPRPLLDFVAKTLLVEALQLGPQLNIETTQELNMLLDKVASAFQKLNQLSDH